MQMVQGPCLSSLSQQEEFRTIAVSCGGPGLDLYFPLVDGKSLCQYIVNEQGSQVSVKTPSPVGIAEC